MSRLSLLADATGCPPSTTELFVRSLQRQIDPSWQLVLAVPGDAAADPPAGDAGGSVRVVHGTTTARRLRAALEAAEGNLVTVLDPYGWLHPEAVATLTAAFEADPEVDVVYADEEWGPVDGPAVAVRKTGWSPTYLRGCFYLGRPVVVRTSLLRGVGGVRDVPGEAMAWDLALRTSDLARRVVHLPDVLYHGLEPPPSDPAHRAPADVGALEQVLRDDCARTDQRAVPERISRGWFRLRRPFETWPSIGAVIPTAGTPSPTPGRMRVEDCLDDLLDGTDHGPLDVCVVISGNSRDGIEDRLRRSYGERVRVVRLSGSFNYSRSVNAGVRSVRGDLVLLLNDDTRVVHRLWLRRMAEHALDPRVGVVGAKLLFPDGRIQHVGVTLGLDAGPRHPGTGDVDGLGYQLDQLVDLDYLAVTGACQLLRREVFTRAGGYDTELPLNYNDIDFCLKVSRVLGLAVRQLNGAELVHAESSTRAYGVVHASEHERFFERWLIRDDPYRRDRDSTPRAPAVPAPV